MLWTTKLSDDAAHFLLSSDAEALTHYCSATGFSQPRDFYTDSPYQRPSRPQDVTDAIISTRLTSDQLSHSQHLLAQRLLLNIYEQDLVFLPKPPMALDLKAFKNFYDPQHAASGKKIRPLLEQYLYNWLKEEVHINGPWCLDSFVAHTDKVLDDVARSDSKLHEVLTTSRHPERAARFFMTQ